MLAFCLGWLICQTLSGRLTGESFSIKLLWQQMEGSFMQLKNTPNTPAAIWSRLIRPERNDMNPEAARFFLDLEFDQQDLDRMHELAVKNQADELSADEVVELQNYRQMGLQLDFLRAKARKAIRSQAKGH